MALLLAAGCSFAEGPDWPASETGNEAAGLGQDTNAQPAEAKAHDLGALLGGTAAPVPAGGGAVLLGRVRPLVTIRLGDAERAYEDALYRALRAALERRPQTAFDLVAVTPALDGPDHAVLIAQSGAVLRVLAAMGLPAARLSLSAATDPGVAGNELRIYVR